MSKLFLNLWSLLFWPNNGLSWRLFFCTWRMSILLLLGEMFYVCLWCVSIFLSVSIVCVHLFYSVEVLCFPFYFLFGCSIYYWKHSLYCWLLSILPFSYVNVSFICLNSLLLGSHIYNCHVFLMYCFFYHCIMSFFVSSVSFLFYF